jgi:hypothetical protein
MAKVETERFFGKKGIIIMMRDGNKMVSAIFKDKKNADKYNRNNPADVKKLLQLAKKTKFPKAIDEDTDVGHQDDEPNMLKSTALEIMEYGKKLMDKLDKYDDMEGEVDFPNWWQSKLTLARDYVSKAYHYLDSEEKTSENIDRNFRTYADDEGDDEGPVDEGKKRYYQQDRVGSAKYTISYHDGKKKHKDGSDFFDISTFKNKKDLAKFVNDLNKGGYKYGFGESVNEAMKPSQVRSAISKVKKQLMRKWKQKGGYENFGQKELSKMRDKFDYNPYGSPDERQIAKMLDGFDNWAMNYDGNMREAYVVLYSPKKGVKPVTTAAYKDKKDAEKWAKDLGGITMIVKKKVKGIDEGYGPFIKAKNLTDIIKLSKQKKNATFYVTDDNNSRIGTFYLKNGKFAKATTANPNYDFQRNKTKLKDRSDVIYKYKVDESVNEDKNQIVQLKKKVGKSEIKFYDALSKIEKKLGKKKYRAFLEKGLKDFKINAKHYDYRSNGAAEEKLFQLAK